ncbi:MAG: TolC family protein [Desulfobacterales bacterium]
MRAVSWKKRHPPGFLNISSGRPFAAALVHPVSDPFIRPAPMNDLEDRLMLADRSRPDLNEARMRQRQNRLETVVTRNGLLPELELFAALGRTGYADNFSDAVKALDDSTYDVSAGLRLSSVAGNRAAEARHEAAGLSLRQSAEAVANLRQIVDMEVRLAMNEVERIRQQIVASHATRMLEEEKLQAEKERFDVGAGTSLLVAQAQRDLLISRIAEVRSVIHYRIALVNLYLAEGSLLERRGIRVE